ncbi:hypothetical protein Leryth_010001 [Lithospermum erythrorhizon]|nr:hypothetical protein Leryth_010001 [Lithospermum erythrorhizon]
MAGDFSSELYWLKSHRPRELWWCGEGGGGGRWLLEEGGYGHGSRFLAILPPGPRIRRRVRFVRLRKIVQRQDDMQVPI